MTMNKPRAVTGLRRIQRPRRARRFEEGRAGMGWAATVAVLTSVPHAGVEDDVEDVHQEEVEDVDGGGVEDEPLDGGVVGGGDGVEDVAAETGPGEDVFDEDDTAEEVAVDDGGHRQQREDGVEEGVAEDDGPLGETEGAGGAGLVGVEGFDHAGAGHAGEGGHDGEGEDAGGHDEGLRCVAEGRPVTGEEGVDGVETGDGTG